MSSKESISLFSKQEKIAIIIMIISGSLYLYSVSPIMDHTIAFLIQGNIKELMDTPQKELLPYPLGIVAGIVCLVNTVYIFRGHNNCP